ncbi:MAG TPA: hypothetical protein VF883_05120 [Thermoanaerobaculia bacterium]|jgi:hypothetical protein
MKSFLRGEPLRERVITLPRMQFLPVHTVANVSDDVLARYVGSYRVDEKNVRRVFKAGSVLWTIREGTPPFALRPMSPTEFFYENGGATVRFEVDGQGKPTAMVFRTATGEEQRAVKE